MAQQKPADRRPDWHKNLSDALKKNFDLTIALCITVVTLACVFTPYLNETFLRALVGLIFVFAIPGYVLVAALFPRKSDVSNTERVALSFGGSIGLMALIGFALNFTPYGLRLESLLFCAVTITLAGAVMAIRRRGALSKADRFFISVADVRNAFNGIRYGTNTRTDRMLSVIALTSLIVSASIFAYLVIVPSSQHFTELYILGQYGKAEGYPTNFLLNETRSVTVGVVNNENRDTTYNLVVRLNATENVTTLYTDSFTLENGKTWQKSISLTPQTTGNDMKMEFLLYKDQNRESPYREAYFRVNVTA